LPALPQADARTGPEIQGSRMSDLLRILLIGASGVLGRTGQTYRVT